MKRNRRDSIRKERIIMVASSAFVLAALTMTGLYMRGQEAKQQDDGYTLDFTALENSGNGNLDLIGNEQAKNTTVGNGTQIDSDLDYMPLEEDSPAQVDSHLIQIPGLTDDIAVNEAPEVGGNASDSNVSENGSDSDNKSESSADTPSENAGNAGAETTQTARQVELHYNEEQGLTKPVSGEVLMHYNMDGTVYFATLNQYKYNPATLFTATEGEDVVACAEGRVVNVYQDAKLGNAVELELGDGYVATYGQLSDIMVEKDGYVKAGDKLGTVAAPSRFYLLEGTNLYFSLKKDDTSVNAENLF
ncbi:MAG: M23 family metallopeptidase [Clostridium sp.]|nr:M23 family metallopeptidase [Acetatifactor muris]MCM1526706.1 M23 family metallopeptidase [Bacteroides sp.]MCM1562834.1 M23 family metallopeptidase [Clostridium sp.]